LETLLFLKREGYPEVTVETVGRRLRNIGQNCDLDNPEDVKRCIAEKQVNVGFKSNLCDAYSHYLRCHGLTWKRPRYKREHGLPKVPSTENVERIIARSSWRYATIFSVLRDTGAMPEELHRTKFRDIDLENGTINILGCKWHKPRILRLKPQTIAMLKRYLAENQQDQPFPDSSRIYEAWRRSRNDLAKRLNDPVLKKIRLYDLRHYFGTMLYHKTRDILLTKEAMGHSRIETTLVYTKLINFNSDEYVVRAAQNLKEATELLEAGFEYVTEMEGLKLFRKPR